MTDEVRIATRKSPLALWQAEYVQQALLKSHPELNVVLCPMSTRGDKILDTSLAKIGGKGLFIKELEQALLEGRADIAVHSMKDVPMDFPAGLELGAICVREDPLDAFVSNTAAGLDDLPQGACVGTSSLRRASQLLHHRPDLKIADCRGNVNTRLAKLDTGEFDAIILASAGLKRLGMQARIRQALAPEICLPAPGQGAVGIEMRSGDSAMQHLLAALNDQPTAQRVGAERAMNTELQGGCQVPIAAFAELGGGELELRGLVANDNGTRILRASGRAPGSSAMGLGQQVAQMLLDQGAAELLALVDPH